MIILRVMNAVLGVSTMVEEYDIHVRIGHLINDGIVAKSLVLGVSGRRYDHVGSSGSEDASEHGIEEHEPIAARARLGEMVRVRCVHREIYTFSILGR